MLGLGWEVDPRLVLRAGGVHWNRWFLLLSRVEGAQSASRESIPSSYPFSLVFSARNYEKLPMKTDRQDSMRIWIPPHLPYDNKITLKCIMKPREGTRTRFCTPRVHKLFHLNSQVNTEKSGKESFLSTFQLVSPSLSSNVEPHKKY